MRERGMKKVILLSGTQNKDEKKEERSSPLKKEKRRGDRQFVFARTK